MMMFLNISEFVDNQLSDFCFDEKLDLFEDLTDQGDDLFLFGRDPYSAIHAYDDFILDLFTDEL